MNWVLSRNIYRSKTCVNASVHRQCWPSNLHVKPHPHDPFVWFHVMRLTGSLKDPGRSPPLTPPQHLHSASYPADPVAAYALALQTFPTLLASLAREFRYPFPYIGQFFNTRTQFGFPSRAEDRVREDVDLTARCIRRPLDAFFVEASGNSMRDFGIHSGDILVVDLSNTAK